jgi:predicted 3-demethylubiquinone-9 3-methyltransferase (glyoxalase superfamily)
MSKISPCLWFTNQAAEAANFYVSLLPDSRIDRVTRSTVDLPSGPAGSVLLVSFTLAGQAFLALNGGVPQDHTHAISFSIDCADQAEVDRLWDRLSDGGTPVQCGWVTDRYGISWQVVPSVLPKLLNDPDTKKTQRVMQAMLRMIKLDIAALQAAYDEVSSSTA